MYIFIFFKFPALIFSHKLAGLTSGKSNILSKVSFLTKLRSPIRPHLRQFNVRNDVRIHDL